MADYSLIFAQPVWLWGLPALAAAAAALAWVAATLRRRRLAKLCGPASRWMAMMPRGGASPTRWWRTALVVSAMAALLLTLAGPQVGRYKQPGQSVAYDTTIALDLSRSMYADDRKPSRLEAAKDAIRKLIQRGDDSRLSLIGFAGNARLIAPLTADRAAIELILGSLTPRSIGRGGTDLADAIDLAAERARHDRVRNPVLVILSDGEQLQGDAVLAARRAQLDLGMRTYTVGVGTRGGQPLFIPQYDPKGKLVKRTPVRDAFGQQVHSRLDEATLRAVAAAGDGAYAPLGDDGSGLLTVIDQGAKTLTTTTTATNLQQRHELFQLSLGLALLLLVGSLLPGDWRRRGQDASRHAQRPARARASALAASTAVVLALLTPPGLVRAQSTDAPSPKPVASTSQAPNPALFQARRLLLQHQPQSAMKVLQTALLQTPNDPYLLYNYGVAAAAADQSALAKAAFESLSGVVSSDQLQGRGHFQLGNLSFKDGYELQRAHKTDDAIASYEQAREWYRLAAARTGGRDVSHNLRVTEAQLLELYPQRAKQDMDRAAGQLRRSKVSVWGLRNAASSAQQAEQDLNAAKELTDDASKKQQLDQQVAKARKLRADALLALARDLARIPDLDKPDQAQSVRARHVKQARSALQAYDDYLTTFPGDPNHAAAQHEQATLRKQLANLFEHEGDKARDQARQLADKHRTEQANQVNGKALGSYQQAADLEPNDKPLQKKIDDLKAQMLEQDQAVARYKLDKGREILPKNTDAAVSLLRSAQQNVEKAQTIDPHNERTEQLAGQTKRALAQALRQQAAESRGDAKQALAKNDTASTERAVGLLDRSANDYRTANRLDPQQDFAEPYRQTLDELAQAREQLARQQLAQRAAQAQQPAGAPQNAQTDGSNADDALVMKTLPPEENGGGNYDTRDPPVTRDW